MRITHLGHACVLIESAAGSRLLIDPGAYSQRFEDLTGLNAIATTHQHPDHLDPERLGPLHAANPDAALLIETETVDALQLQDDRLSAISAGETFEAGDLTVRAVGGRHAIIHDQVPGIGNVGLVVEADGTRFFHPGDSYDAAPDGIDVLGLPLNAPWCRVSETLGFLQAVSPRVAIPIHTALLSEIGMTGYLTHAQRFGPDGCETVDVRPGSSYTV
jgi:L-ascorbate metabolism protein UlaG (beta-lactamase superfamily)